MANYFITWKNVLLISAILSAFIFIIAPAMVFSDDFQHPPMVYIKVLSATPTSIELRHNGGDNLRLSDMQFTVKKADGKLLRPSIVNSSDRFWAGDIIILSAADFGNIGDNIDILAEYNYGYSNSPKFEILKNRTQIQN